METHILPEPIPTSDGHLSRRGVNGNVTRISCLRTLNKSPFTQRCEWKHKLSGGKRCIGVTSHAEVGIET